MTRPRRQAGEAQAMEQIIDAAQGVGDPEFFPENALGLFGPQGTDAIGLRGLGPKTLLERNFFLRRQMRRSPGRPLGNDRVQPPIPIHIDPALHERPAASQDTGDGGSLVTFEGQQHGSIPVPLLGVLLLTASLTQLRQILWMVKRDLHPTVPPVFSRVCQKLTDRATLF
jgi:hypothetical protein